MRRLQIQGVAIVLEDHEPLGWLEGGEWGCSCGLTFAMPPEHTWHVADQVANQAWGEEPDGA